MVSIKKQLINYKQDAYCPKCFKGIMNNFLGELSYDKSKFTCNTCNHVELLENTKKISNFIVEDFNQIKSKIKAKYNKNTGEITHIDGSKPDKENLSLYFETENEEYIFGFYSE